MSAQVTPFLLHWLITGVSLWAASYVFAGLKFDTVGALIVSALMLGFANAILRPILLVLTFPLTIVTFGLFILVINALMVLLVARLVKGFHVTGFWTAFFAGIFVTVLSLFLAAVVGHASGTVIIDSPGTGPWV